MTATSPGAPRSGRILVVDDDAAIGAVLAALLRQGGHQATYAGSAAEALATLARESFDVVLTDLRMPEVDGMELLRIIARRWPGLPVVILTAHGTVPLAVEAMRHGAADFLLKPFDRAEILFVLGKVLMTAENASIPTGDPAGQLIGDAPVMREVHGLLRKAAVGAATVLVRGESGTGKELVARAIHDQSPRRAGPFVKLHCAALPDSLLESELFGYERGAFTGATTRKPGRIELADGGTLFLDEIGDITPATQVKLLRVLQERSFERLGSGQTLCVDVRFVAATYRDLEDMVRNGQFREDLFYRLNVVPLWLPPLRERRGDIPALVRHFTRLHGASNGRPDIAFQPAAVERLAAESWPGNVRQLQNFIERLVVLAAESVITTADVEAELCRGNGTSRAPASGGAPSEATLDERRRDAERRGVLDALARAGNNRTLAARLLGISRRTLYTKLADYGIG